jgi:hypothetical protein
MESFLKNLYYGNINPEETMSISDPKFRELNHNVLKQLEDLKDSLDEQEYKKIIKLSEINSEANALETVNAFTHGFKYGAIMMMEILKNEKT